MDGTGREGEASEATGGGAPGGLIPGYDVLGRIGTGGSSTVYRAIDVRHQRPVAVKVLDAEASSGSRRTAFQREIEAIGRIGSHPYIVTVLGSGFTGDNHPYLVLPLFERGTFGRLIDEHGPLTWATAVDIGIKLCSAVETVHRAGVVHRDIKPGNVFVGVTPEHPLLADFGISSTVEGERTQTETMSVTFGYTAPEVLDDERPTPASDVYSLAMTIFRLIQGLHAYHAESPAAVMRRILSDPDRPQLSAGVPRAVAAVVADALARDPAARPASALVMAHRFQQAQIDHDLPPTPIVVADEPAVGVDADVEVAVNVDVDLDVDPAGAAPIYVDAAAGRDLEDAMVAAARRRQPSASAPHATSRVHAVPAPAPPERRQREARADVGRLLADAITTSTAGSDRETPTAVDLDGMPPHPPRDPSLDLPTVVTPRRPRGDSDTDSDTPDMPPVDRRRWYAALAFLVVAVLVLAAVVSISRSNGSELAPGGGFVGGDSSP